MPFGKHEGKLLKDIPIDYIEWLSGRDLKEPLKSMVNELLNGNKEYEPSIDELLDEELPFK